MRFGIAAYQHKTDTNTGTLFRTSYLYNAWNLASIGRKYKKQSSDTCDSINHIPYYFFEKFEQFANYYRNLKFELVAVELDEKSNNLIEFEHPTNAIYILGNEGYGIHKKCLDQCDSIVQIPTKQPISMNVAVAGSIVIYDRFFKLNSSWRM